MFLYFLARFICIIRELVNLVPRFASPKKETKNARLTRRYLNLSFTALHALNSSAIAASNRTACDVTLTSNFKISSCRPILKWN